MPFHQVYQPGRLGLSFELFPPKTPEGEQALFGHVEQLLSFSPDFITCTYGAGGSTRDKTLEIITRVKQQFSLPVASHLTCVGATVDQLREYLGEAQQRGVDAIVALRGDPPQGESNFVATDGGLRYASDLVRLIDCEFPEFDIAVAGYPETHQEALSPQSDLENLKRKIEAGGDIVITQLFYDNRDFFEFRERCEAIGIQSPIIPGLLPVTSLAQIQRITSLCGAKLPESFVSRLGQKEDADWQTQVGIEFAADQTRELVESGVAGLHFYVLNKSQATSAVLSAVDLGSREATA